MTPITASLPAARVRTFKSGHSAISVKVLDEVSQKRQWRPVRLVPASQPWTNALLETIKAECLAKQAESKAAKPQAVVTLIEALDTWYDGSATLEDRLHNRRKSARA